MLAASDSLLTRKLLSSETRLNMQVVTVSYIFQGWQQLGAELDESSVSNPRDLWEKPEMTLRILRAIELNID